MLDSEREGKDWETGTAPVVTVSLPLTVPTGPDVGFDCVDWEMRVGSQASAEPLGHATVIQLSLGQLSCTNHPLN